MLKYILLKKKTGTWNKNYRQLKVINKSLISSVKCYLASVLYTMKQKSYVLALTKNDLDGDFHSQRAMQRPPKTSNAREPILSSLLLTSDPSFWLAVFKFKRYIFQVCSNYVFCTWTINSLKGAITKKIEFFQTFLLLLQRTKSWPQYGRFFFRNK